MLRSSFLFDPGGRDLPLSTGSAPRRLREALGVVLVMPRRLCLYLRLDARGVPALRLRSFARLQLLAQSPIVEPEVFAARQGELLHLWLWERSAVEAFAGRQGLPRSRIETVPSSLFTEPKGRDGALLFESPLSAGLHAQLWQAGRLLHDGWFDEQPDPLTWQVWCEEARRQHGVDWPGAVPVRSAQKPAPRPWAANLLQPRGGIAVDAPAAARTALACTTVASLAWGAWLHAQLWVLRSEIEQARGAEAEITGRLRPMQQARASALQAQAWVLQADRLRPSPSASELLERIGNALTGQGAVVRDLEIQGDSVRATVVAAAGELSLPELTQALTRVPGFDDVRFVDAASARGFRFSWRLGGAGIASGGSGLATGAERS